MLQTNQSLSNHGVCNIHRHIITIICLWKKPNQTFNSNMVFPVLLFSSACMFKSLIKMFIQGVEGLFAVYNTDTDTFQSHTCIVISALSSTVELESINFNSYHILNLYFLNPQTFFMHKKTLLAKVAHIKSL